MHSICCMVVWFPQNSKNILTDGDEKKNRCNNRFILNMAKVSENLQQTSPQCERNLFIIILVCQSNVL